jgi:hypothetical protein
MFKLIGWSPSTRSLPSEADVVTGAGRFTFLDSSIVVGIRVGSIAWQESTDPCDEEGADGSE